MITTWLEISKKALLNNIFQIKKILQQKTKFMAVIKANAYGHGLLEVAKLIENKVDYFAVYAFRDALLLRQNGFKKKLLVLERAFLDQVDLAIKHDIELTVTTFDILQKVKKNLKIHICVDTGLGRDGFIEDDMKKVVNFLRKSPLHVVGLYAHFASADDFNFDDYTKNQARQLLRLQEEFLRFKINPLIHHCASASTLIGKVSKHFDMARIGVSLYGLWPSKQIKKSKQNQVKLTPVLSWKAKILEVKFLKKGSAISYNCTHILQRDSKLAVLGIGYFDGIPRLASNKAFVIVKGKKVPQIGRVTMNLIVLDVTEIENVKVGDIATIIGCEKKVAISADDWAEFSQSSNYEIVTRINSGIKRVVV